ILARTLAARRAKTLTGGAPSQDAEAAGRREALRPGADRGSYVTLRIAGVRWVDRPRSLSPSGRLARIRGSPTVSRGFFRQVLASTACSSRPAVADVCG